MPQNGAPAPAFCTDISDNTPSHFALARASLETDWIVRRRRSASDKGWHFSAALSWNPKLEKVMTRSDHGQNELRDTRLLAAMMASRPGIADELVFPSQVGTVIKPDNIAPRYMEPALGKAGLRHFRFHDLRHTFGGLLIQDGASLVHVKEQMGHSSIQITVDTYGHLIPGADIAWVDRLDSKTAAQQNATPAQQAPRTPQKDCVEVLEKNWLPPRDSNPDMLIQSSIRETEGKEDKRLSSEKSSKVLQNPQQDRNKE